MGDKAQGDKDIRSRNLDGSNAEEGGAEVEVAHRTFLPCPGVRRDILWDLLLGNMAEAVWKCKGHVVL
jgi:hypothetical protein